MMEKLHLVSLHEQKMSAEDDGLSIINLFSMDPSKALSCKEVKLEAFYYYWNNEYIALKSKYSPL